MNRIFHWYMNIKGFIYSLKRIGYYIQDNTL